MTDQWDQFPDAPAQQNDPWAAFPDARSPQPSAPQPTSSQPEVSPFWSSKTGRFLQGAEEPLVGAAQLAAHATGYGAKTMDEMARRNEDYYKASRAAAGLKPEDWDYWAGAGNIASTVVPSLVAPEIGALRATGMGANLLKGAATGAGTAAVQPVTGEGDYTSQKLQQVGEGALTGGVGSGAITAAGKVIKPAVSEAAQKMIDAGVKLTPGQILGGAARSIESAGESFPLFGTMIKEARGDTIGQFNTAVGNKVLKPIGERVDKGIAPGHDLIEHVEDKIGDAYSRIHPNVSLQMDGPLFADINNILRSMKSKVSPEEIDQFKNLMKDEIAGKINANSGRAPGDVVQSITSELSSEMRGYRTDSSFNKRKLGRFIGDARAAVGRAIERQNPAYAKDLENTNLAWSNYVKMQDAAAKQGTVAGKFSPAQLEASSKKGETVGTKAKGKSKLQDFAEAGKEVLPSNVPDSGTPIRSALMGLATHGAGYGLLGPHALIPGAAIAGIYNPIGLAMARAALLARPPGAQTARNILEKNAPVIGSRAPYLAKKEEPEMLPPVRVEQASGGTVHPHAHRLNEIESAPLSPEQKRDMRRKIIEDALRNP